MVAFHPSHSDPLIERPHMRTSPLHVVASFSMLSLLGALTAFPGCGSDGKGNGGGGNGGSAAGAGRGGAAGTGGSGGAAGTGGTAGTGGSAAGTGGSAAGAGGAAGTGGSAAGAGGAGGAGGRGGGGAGAGGSAAGAGGAAGTGGSAGAVGAAGTGGGGAGTGGSAGAGGAAGTGGGGAGAGGSGADPDGGTYDGPMPAALTLTIAPLGTSTATGTAVFEKIAGNQIKLTVIVSGVMPVSAEHGIHIHANGDCGSTSDGDGGTVPGGAAGGHWNPDAHQHGTSVETSHLGDIGNIMVGASGVGTLTFMTDKWTMGTGATNDILNHALVLHASRDDGVTQPTGNAGGRIGCVVIR